MGNSSLLVTSTYRLVGKSLNHHIAELLVGTKMLQITLLILYPGISRGSLLLPSMASGPRSFFSGVAESCTN